MTDVPLWCACLGIPEPSPTWHFPPGHNMPDGSTPDCGFGDEDDDEEGWFDMNTSDAYEGTPASSPAAEGAPNRA